MTDLHTASARPRPVEHIPRRVVSLVPSVTESLFDLDLGDRLVAVTDYCVRPADKVARLRKVGGTKNPDIETIIALRPDLVIMNREENRKADAEALQAAGIPLWVATPYTVKQAIDLLWDIMNVFEHAVMTERVRFIDIACEQTRQATAELTPVRAFVPIWRDPWMTANRDTYLHDLLATCGADNVFADRDRRIPLAADLGTAEPLSADDPRLDDRDMRYPRITLDEVVAAQPDLILLPNEPYEFTEEDAQAVAALDTPAGARGQVYLIDGSLLTWHGTRIAYALQDIPPVITAAREAMQDG
jgi:ABC-type Fe3+-hydroxamate transport system substrate-binding protein